MTELRTSNIVDEDSYAVYSNSQVTRDGARGEAAHHNKVLVIRGYYGFLKLQFVTDVDTGPGTPGQQPGWRWTYRYGGWPGSGRGGGGDEYARRTGQLIELLSQGETRVETFTLTTTDSQGLERHQTIRVTIRGTSDTPEIIDITTNANVFSSGEVESYFIPSGYMQVDANANTEGNKAHSTYFYNQYAIDKAIRNNGDVNDGTGSSVGLRGLHLSPP